MYWNSSIFKRNRANLITVLRIVFSAALLFVPALSPAFFVFYTAAGVTDVLDGFVARKTNTVSEFGSKLDTAADFVLVAVCLVKLLPVLDVPIWLFVWVAVITLIKAINLISGFVVQRRFVSAHTVMNKITGGLLFALPFTLPFIPLKFTGAFVCAAATVAAIQEGHLIRAKRV